MDADFVLHIAKRGLEVALLLAAPVLVVTLLVGFGSALLQAVTSIRDMTLGMVLKIAAVGVTVLFAGGWMLEVAQKFTVDIFAYMQEMGR